MALEACLPPTLLAMHCRLALEFSGTRFYMVLVHPRSSFSLCLRKRVFERDFLYLGGFNWVRMGVHAFQLESDCRNGFPCPLRHDDKCGTEAEGVGTQLKSCKYLDRNSLSMSNAHSVTSQASHSSMSCSTLCLPVGSDCSIWQRDLRAIVALKSSQSLVSLRVEPQDRL